jgi:hypothetical protein
MRENCQPEARQDSYLPEKIQIKFAKLVLGVNKSAVNSAVLSELGLLPIYIYGFKASVGYWYHIKKCNDSSIVKNAYLDSIHLNKGFGFNFKMLLNKIGFQHVWHNQDTFSINSLTKAVFTKLRDRYLNYWYANLHNDEGNPNGNKLRTFRKFKVQYQLEQFLLTDVDKWALHDFIKIRISNSKLLIETGRHIKSSNGCKLPLAQRICPLCNDGVEDEFHFVLKCNLLAHERSVMVSNICECMPSFILMDNETKLCFIMGNSDPDINRICIVGIHKMYQLRQSLYQGR